MQRPQLPVAAMHAGVVPLHAVPGSQLAPSEAQVSGTAPLHRFAPGAHATHLPARQTGLFAAHFSAGSHCPLALQSSGFASSAQRREPGSHAAHAPSTHSGKAPEHVALFSQCPSTQDSTLLPAQRDPGLHSKQPPGAAQSPPSPPAPPGPLPPSTGGIPPWPGVTELPPDPIVTAPPV